MSISISHATQKDLPALSQLARQTFSRTFTHYDAESLEEHLRATCSEGYFSGALASGDTILLAHEGEWLAGYAKAGKLALPVEHPDQPCGELHRLYVAEDQQGKGIGRKLMEAMLAEPCLRDAATLYLGVWEHNHRAQRFYASYGFVPVGEYIYPVGRFRDREIILACRNSEAM